MASPETPQATSESVHSEQGVTSRVIVLALGLAVLFGFAIPIVDYKMSNTFLGAAHLPAASMAVLLLFLLVLNPLLNFVAGRSDRLKPLMLGVAVCALGWLVCWKFHERAADAIAPLSPVFFYLSILAFLSTAALIVARRAKQWLLLLGCLAAIIFTRNVNNPEDWASTLVLLRWVLPAIAVILLVGLALRRPLSRNETLTVYITCLFSALAPGRGSENFFIPNILSSFYFATPENKWLDYMKVKAWMTPALNADGSVNTAVLQGWYSGTGGVVPWVAWLVPLVAWCALILAIHTMQGCLGVMLRAQWAQREALAFPLLRLPLQMTEDLERHPLNNTTPFFRNPVMWIGFGIAVVIETLNGLNLYYPEVPNVPLQIPTGPLMSEPPWNQIGLIDLRVFPAILGIAFLLTSEVSFSLWFLYLLTKAQLIIAYYMGFPPNSLPTPFWTRGWAKGFVGYQQVGAIICYSAILLWIGREHFAHILRRAFRREAAKPGESDEALSYPAAFWGFVAALTFAIGWTVLAGVKLPVALLIWGLYLTIALCLTRLVAEGGLMFVHTGWMTLGPLAFLFGPKIIDAASAAPASIISGATMFELRGFLLPSFVQGFKLAHDRKIAAKKLFVLIFGVTVISFWLSVWSIVRMGYESGGLQLQRWWVDAGAKQAAQHTIGISRDLGPENFLLNWFWAGVGALTTWGIMLGRSRLSWFPLHPIGLLMCVPFAMYSMWVSLMIGWLCKTLITRYGGTDAYRAAMPAFLGLALGDILMVVFWVIVDGWQGRMNHSLLPF